MNILGLVADAEALVGQNTEPVGKLRVTAPVSFGCEAMTPALTDFYHQFPKISIDLVLSDRNVDLIQDDVDIAIRIGRLPDSGLVSRKLCDYTMSVCASPAYLETHGIPDTPEKLSQHNCLFFQASAGMPWRFKKDGLEHAIDVEGNLQINHGQGLKRAALEGLGVILQPHILMERDIQAGRLVRLFQAYNIPSREVHIVYLRDRNIPFKKKCFIDFLIQYFSR